MNRTIKRVAFLAVAGIALVMTATGCAEIAEPDKVGLYYAEGQSDGYKFDHCIDPGATDDALWNNSVVWLNNNLRTWNIAPAGGDTSTPITVASKPEPNQPSGVQVNVWSQTNLMLNTNCSDANSILVRWWEKMGRRYNADTEDGWKAMLLNTVVPALEKAQRTVLRGYGADELVAGTVLPEVQSKVSAEFATELKRLTGDDYFCGPTFVRGSDTCPAVEVLVKDIDYTDPGIQEARNQKQKALETAAAQVAEAEGKAKALVAEAEGKVKAAAAQSELYRNAAWIELEKARLHLAEIQACAASASCTVITGSSGGVIVQNKG